MQFEFATAARIIFGAGKMSEAGPIARSFGRRALLVTGRNADRSAPLNACLAASGVFCVPFAVAEEPTVSLVTRGTGLARSEHCDQVIALGGGSAIDTGKAIAAMMTNPGDLSEHLEVVGLGRPLVAPSAPFIAIPTTAGTGAEVTRNAVLASPEHRVKVSLRSAYLLPRVALVDPELTRDLPPGLTASTGLDALTQLIEPYVSIRANPLTDALCVDGIHRVARSLRRACANGADETARQDMALASLFGGLALANAGLGAVHGFAAPIGGMVGAPHGAICAALLAEVIEMNLRALRRRAPDSVALRRYDEIGRLLTNRPGARANDAIEWIRQLRGELCIPSLGSHGVAKEHLPALVETSARASSMKGNPIALTPEEMRETLEKAL